MEKKPQPSRFLGDWTPRTFDGSLKIEERNPGAFHIAVNGRDVGGPMGKDDQWHNLKSAEACLSLHGGSGRLFGLYLDSGYRTVAAFRQRSRELPGPPCGKDSPIFGSMLRPNGFKIRTLVFDGLERPVEVDDWVAIRRSADNGDYLIGKIQADLFKAFDQLCPDADNGNLNSRLSEERKTMRTITLWEWPQTKDRLFSMVAIPRETALEARDLAGDPDELARSLGLLPFELMALQELLPSKPGPGDPLIIWGADDGGG